MKRKLIYLPTILAISILMLATVFVPGSRGDGTQDPAASIQVDDRTPQNKVLARALAIQRGEVIPAKYEMPLSAGVMGALIQRYEPTLNEDIAKAFPSAGIDSSSSSTGFEPPNRPASQGCPNIFEGDDDDDDNGHGGIDNIRVNQDCTLRRQAEEWVGVNPKNSKNVVAGQNDSMIGFNHGGFDWSLDRGQTWGSVGTQPAPFWQEILLDGHTADAFSDPAGTFDHLGNVYITGVFFDVLSPASAIFVAKSNWPIQGRFYHVPNSTLSFQEYRATPMGKPASDNNPNIFHDKELMVADARPASTKKGRVYVTWTRFEATTFGVGARSPIVFSQSTDGGATWSPQVIISGSSVPLCTVASGSSDPNACDQDQGSHPVVGPDGTIYVIFGNGNTPLLGINQVMMVKCPPGNACTSPTDWTPPVKVGDLIGTHPAGSSPYGCPNRQCLPPNGYRVPEFTSISISVDQLGRLYAIWADHRNNTNSMCQFPTTGATASPPCDHDVFYAFSTTGGATWSPTITVTPRSRLGETAQWQPWSDVMGDGSIVQAAFYDRHYGNCEFAGCNDITLATISNPRSASPTIKYKRITTGSMPNLLPSNNPIQAGFLGDYMWLELSRHSFSQRTTHIVWADTRQLFGPAPEEDVYFASVK